MGKWSTNPHVIDYDQHKIIHLLRNFQGIISLVWSHVLVLAIFEELSQLDAAA